MSQKHHQEHKNRKESCGSLDHDLDNQDDASQVDIEEEVIKKIKALPTLKEKVQTIAINSYLIQKRQLDQKLGREIEEIQQKFRKAFNPYIQEISKIIQGKHAFTDIDFQQIGELLTQEEMSNKHNYFNNEKIPQYWLKVLINSQSLGEQIEEKDQPLLKHLQRIQGHRAQDLSKLSLVFYFSQNQWFSNQKLQKNFDIKGDQITKSYGDQIHWKEGKNITIKIVKKKGKKGGQKKTKEVKQKSFFNFFKDIQIDSQQQEQQQVQQEDEETDDVEQLQRQYQIAQSIYEDLIPKSLQYYLNIVGSADFEGEDFDGEEEENEEVTCSNGKEKKKK